MTAWSSKLAQLILQRYRLILLFLFLLIQVVLVLTTNPSQTSDAARYVQLARNSLHSDTLYPSQLDVYSPYIFAPGYVNLLILLFRVFGENIRAALFVNVFLNCILLWEITFLIRHHFGERVAAIGLTIFFLHPVNYGTVLYTATELPFTVLAYGSLCLLLRRGYWPMFGAGVLVALANWVRPLGVVFVLAAGAVAVWEKVRLKRVLVYVAGCLVTVVVIGWTTYARMGYFNYASTTGGVNMVMGAHDNATGEYAPVVFQPGHIGYIPDVDSKTFEQRDAIWTRQAVAWIRAHPVKWVGLIPRKLYYMYFWGNENLSKMLVQNRLVHWGIVYGTEVYYLIVSCFAVLGVIRGIMQRTKGTFILLVIVLVGTGLTILTVGSPRYKYPYLPTWIAFASVAVAWYAYKPKRERIGGVVSGEGGLTSSEEASGSGTYA